MEILILFGIFIMAYAVGTNRNKISLLIRVHELQDKFMYKSRRKIEILENEIEKLKKAV
jgi:hypothetical protein